MSHAKVASLCLVFDVLSGADLLLQLGGEKVGDHLTQCSGIPLYISSVIETLISYFIKLWRMHLRLCCRHSCITRDIESMCGGIAALTLPHPPSPLSGLVEFFNWQTYRERQDSVVNSPETQFSAHINSGSQVLI